MQNIYFEILNFNKIMHTHLDYLYLDVDVVDAFNTIHRVIFILRSNQSFLMETIQLHKGFIDQLRLSNCLSDVQSRLLKRQVVISGKRKQIGRNNSSDLLHVIRKCDDKMRSDCFRCFRQSDQKLVTKVLDNEGGLA